MDPLLEKPHLILTLLFPKQGISWALTEPNGIGHLQTGSVEQEQDQPTVCQPQALPGCQPDEAQRKRWHRNLKVCPSSNSKKEFNDNEIQ